MNNQKLFYSVAGHTFCIETPDAEATASLIHWYEPFRVNKPSSADNDLVVLRSNCQINFDTNQVPADKDEINGLSIEVYPQSDNSTIIKLTHQDNNYFLHASADWSSINTDLTFIKQDEIMIIKSFILVSYLTHYATKKTIKFHASVIEKDGKAILFLGTSGTGKSTHTRLWLKHVEGCSLLNDDEPIVRIEDDNTVRVYGAPWSGSTPCYRNESAQVVAFVRLFQHPTNEMTQCSNIHAFSHLLEASATLRHDKETKARIYDTIFSILEQIPVYELKNRPEEEAVRLSEQLLQTT